MLIFWCLPPLFVKVDAAIFEVNMKKYSHDIMKKLFQRYDYNKNVIGQCRYGIKMFHILFFNTVNGRTCF